MQLIYPTPSIWNQYRRTLVHTGSLSPSSSYTEKFTLQIPSSWKGGPYTVEVSTDTDGAVFESTQVGNNKIKKEFEIQQVLPDLTIDNYNIRITGNEESGAIEVQMNVSIKNVGDISVNREIWYNVIVFSFPSGEKFNLPKVQDNLIIQKGQAYNYTYNIEIQRREMLTADISFIADFYNDLLEKDELNNDQRKSIDLPPLYDIVELSNFTLFDSKINYEIGEASSGEEIVVSVLFSNQKNYATLAGWTDSIYLECDDYYNLLQQTDMKQLKGNETFNAYLKINIPRNIFGDCYINYKHDINKDLVTSVNHTITLKAPIYIEIPPTPDLHPEEINFEATQNGILVSWTVKNIGNQMLGKLLWKDTIIMSKNNSDPYHLGYIVGGEFETQAKLQSYQTYSVSREIIAPSKASGSYYFHVLTDFRNDVDEIDGEENNNLSTDEKYELPKLPQSDLFINTTLTPKQNNITVGHTETIIYKVRNLGGKTRSSSWTDAIILLSSDNTTHSKSFKQHIGSLEKNESYTNYISFTFPFDLKSGNYFIEIKTDINNKVAEENKENNFVFVGPFYIKPNQKVDFHVSVRTSNITFNAGERFSIGYQVTNLGPGSVSLSQPWFDELYLSDDSVLDSSDIVLSVITNSQHLQKNATYKSSFNFTFPFYMPALYYYLVIKVNSEEMIGETLKTNNIAAILLMNNQNLQGHLFLSDIGVQEVTALSNVDFGDQFSANWIVYNNGSKGVSGYKCDSLYLSPDVHWDVYDTEVETKCAPFSISGDTGAANSRITNTLNKRLPLIKEDYYFSIVKTRSNIKELNLLNNEEQSPNATKVSHQKLILGINKKFMSNNEKQNVWVIPDVSAGETLIVKASNNDIPLEIFLRYKEPASIENFDAFAGEFLSPEHTAVISNTKQGSYYILLRYYSGSSKVEFTITAKLAEFEIANVYPKVASPHKPHNTFTITGSLFPSDLSIIFYPKGNQTYKIAPLHIYRFSSTLLYVTTEMFHFKRGDTISVQISDDISGKTAKYQDAVTITQNEIGLPKINVDMRNAFRPGEIADVNIDVINLGGTDVVLPILYLELKGDVILKDIKNNQSIETELFLFVASPDEGPGSYLAPNSISRTIFRVTPLGNQVMSVPVSVGLFNVNEEKEHPYVNSKDTFRPLLYEDRRWDPVWNMFLKNVGKTMKSFTKRLSLTVNHLSFLGKRVISLDELVKYELDLADGFHTGREMYRVVDLMALGEQYPYIKLVRYFNPRLSYRDVPGQYQGHGPFGKGWIAPYW